ncbi:uncharacterized protein LOC109710681 [Ananas comosus]|uniref:Uncharacterized protein LOC109710681 n=1 Tax=Ananas comosus TaxID=4615 RepID=A0A6P5EZM5_ANACO|nr:uncharacterized protein LOC109710681 [Ananas comosus]
MEDDVSPYDDEFADHVSIPSPSRCIEDLLTDVADIGVSSFNEASLTRQEDKGAKEEGGSKNEAATEMPSLGKRERVSDISTMEAPKRARLETNLDSTDLQAGSKSNIDPEDALSPYGDEVDYEFTPSPPEVKNTDENIDVRSDSGTGCSRNEIPIVAKSFLTDRIIDIVKTFDRRQFKSAQEEVSKYCQCLSALGFDTSELERRIKPIFDHAEVIEELVSSPNFVPFVRVMDAGDNLALSQRKLASHMATKDSLLQATRNVSLQLQQTREKIKELEESISHLKSTEAELSLQLEVADDSLKKLQPSQEELQQDVVNAEKEHAAATEVYNDSKESTGLRELIELFEERRQILEI